jgi:hypothetical protein
LIGANHERCVTVACPCNPESFALSLRKPRNDRLNVFDTPRKVNGINFTALLT